MKTIKKTTLIAAITAMAAFAVPAMASAAVWGPINTNKTLNSTSSAQYPVSGVNQPWSFACSSSSLGVHVRGPASSTLDITSASFTGCVTTGSPSCGPVTVTATGLPWTATTTGGPLTIIEHLQVSYPAPYACGPITTNVDGPFTGSFNNSTHTLSVAPGGATTTMTYMGSYVGTIAAISSTQWKDATNTLTLT